MATTVQWSSGFTHLDSEEMLPAGSTLNDIVKHLVKKATSAANEMILSDMRPKQVGIRSWQRDNDYFATGQTL